MTDQQNIVVAIDGHSSCGKSTLAKQLSQHFNFLYIDTGAMYRCVTLYFLNHSIDIEEEAQIQDALDSINIHFEKQEGIQHVFLNNEDVSEAIRTPKISAFVSEVAAISEVRKKLVQQQKEYSQRSNLIMDGRDIGTVVYPNAQLKFYLTASELIRAKRRHKELIDKGIDIDFEAVMANIHKRDFIDSTREDSPLKKATDAVTLDNTDMNHDEQFEFARKLIQDILDNL